MANDTRKQVLHFLEFWGVRLVPKARKIKITPKITKRFTAASGQSKEVLLENLRKELEAGSHCGLHKTCTHLVFGEGNADADIVFVGEAPGFEEDKQGRPFV